MHIMQTLLLNSLLSDSLLLNTLAVHAPIQQKIDHAKNQPADSRILL